MIATDGTVSLAIQFAGAAPIELALADATVRLDPGSVNGAFGGRVSVADLNDKLIPTVVPLLNGVIARDCPLPQTADCGCPADSAGHEAVVLFANGTCEITNAGFAAAVDHHPRRSRRSLDRHGGHHGAPVKHLLVLLAGCTSIPTPDGNYTVSTATLSGSVYPSGANNVAGIVGAFTQKFELPMPTVDLAIRWSIRGDELTYFDENGDDHTPVPIEADGPDSRSVGRGGVGYALVVPSTPAFDGFFGPITFVLDAQGNGVVGGETTAMDLEFNVLGGLAPLLYDRVGHDCPTFAPPDCGCAPGSVGASIISTFDDNHDCGIFREDVMNSAFVKSLVVPDGVVSADGLTIGMTVTTERQ